MGRGAVWNPFGSYHLTTRKNPPFIYALLVLAHFVRGAKNFYLLLSLRPIKTRVRCYLLRRPITKDPFVWRRRSDLSGSVFTAASRIWDPFLTDINERGKAMGMYADAVSVLSTRLNFTVNISLVPESWTAMVEAVGKKEADLGLTGFSQTEERFGKVDFSLAMASSAIKIFYLRDRAR